MRYVVPTIMLFIAMSSCSSLRYYVWLLVKRQQLSAAHQFLAALPSNQIGLYRGSMSGALITLPASYIPDLGLTPYLVGAGLMVGIVIAQYVYESRLRQQIAAIGDSDPVALEGAIKAWMAICNWIVYAIVLTLIVINAVWFQNGWSGFLNGVR